MKSLILKMIKKYFFKRFPSIFVFYFQGMIFSDGMMKAPTIYEDVDMSLQLPKPVKNLIYRIT
jgi:hypothetical protein